MKKTYLLVALIAAVAIVALAALAVDEPNGESATLVILNQSGLTFTFQCQVTEFVPETYDWDVGSRAGHLVLLDVLNDTVTYTFEPGEFGRASCTAWDAQTNAIGVHEIYFDLNTTTVDVNVSDVSFRGCSEVWIVFESFDGPINATIITSAGNVNVTISAGDLEVIPGQYGFMPLYKWNVHEYFNGADEKILGVIIDGQTYTNQNNCAQKFLSKR